MTRLFALLLVAALLAAPTGAAAWGGTGHRFIGMAAARALPKDLPAFLRTPQAMADIGELALEPDNSKNAGKAHDVEAQSGHFVDIDENGRLLGGPPFLPLPLARDAYEKALVPFGLNSWEVGYLPYSIIDTWQVLAKDFATWRVIVAAEANPRWRAHRAFYKDQRRRREMLILIHVGELAHFAGDGAQPLHATTHYNGWGDFPNPKGYTKAKIHAPFEAEFVTRNITLAMVEARMPAPSPCACPVEERTARFLAASSTQVEPLYQLEKDGALKDGDARMIAFAAGRLGVGASETRDLIVEAWRASAGMAVGWRPVRVQDVVSGRVEPYNALRVLE